MQLLSDLNTMSVEDMQALVQFVRALPESVRDLNPADVQYICGELSGGLLVSKLSTLMTSQVSTRLGSQRVLLPEEFAHKLAHALAILFEIDRGMDVDPQDYDLLTWLQTLEAALKGPTKQDATPQQETVLRYVVIVLLAFLHTSLSGGKCRSFNYQKGSLIW